MAFTSTQFALLKADLGFFEPDPATTTYLQRLLEAAASAIETKHITLDSSDIDDELLVSMYAAWLYRKRDSGAGMGEMLRYALHNRIMREASAP